MTLLVMLPIVLPLVAAGLSIALGRSRAAQRVIGLVTLTTLVVSTSVLLVRVDESGAHAVHAGAWRAPVGIAYVADRLAAIMLVVSLVVLLAVLVYAIGQRDVEARHVGFHPVYLVLSSGVSIAFLTGDLFNLFVAFEVLLMASYVLLTLGGRPAQVRSGMSYVVINLLASSLFLLALAFVYAATGTVNMADLAGKMATLPEGLRSALAVLLIVVFGIKAAIFPLFFWLPDSYPTASSPITAVFAGLLTKVGVYALIRSQTLLFPESSRVGTLLLVLAGCTMVVGVFGAIVQNDIKRILSFHIVSQIGYMLLGLGLFTAVGLAAAVFFVVNQIVVKTALFLVGGLVEHRRGTSELDHLSGVARTDPVLAALFLVPALNIAGIPPLSGFVAKLAVVDAGVRAGSYAVVGVGLAVSLLTLYSMTKIWANAFWGPVPERVTVADRVPAEPVPVAERDHRRAERDHRRGEPLMVAGTTALVVLSLAIGFGAGPVHDLVLRTGEDLVDPSAYVAEVLGP